MIGLVPKWFSSGPVGSVPVSRTFLGGFGGRRTPCFPGPTLIGTNGRHDKERPAPFPELSRRQLRNGFDGITRVCFPPVSRKFLGGVRGPSDAPGFWPPGSNFRGRVPGRDELPRRSPRPVYFGTALKNKPGGERSRHSKD